MTCSMAVSQSLLQPLQNMLNGIMNKIFMEAEMETTKLIWIRTFHIPNWLPEANTDPNTQHHAPDILVLI